MGPRIVMRAYFEGKATTEFRVIPPQPAEKPPAAVAVLFYLGVPLLLCMARPPLLLLSWTPLFFLDNSNNRIVYSSGQNQCLLGARQNACPSHPASAPS
jgi:hypothetical protein